MNYPPLHPSGFRALAHNAGYIQGPGRDEYQMGFEQRNPPLTFSVYVPPGTVRAEMYLYFPTSSQGDPIRVSCAMRFGDIPANVNLTLDNWEQYPFASAEYGGRLDGTTWVPAPTGGHCTVVNQNFREALKKGGWLYVRVLQIKGQVFKFQYTTNVQGAGWKEWLASVQWDANGNPSGSVAPPPPQPPPDPDPTPVPGKVSVSVRGQTITIQVPEGLVIEVK